MRRAERVVFALAALGEAGQAAALAQGADAVAPAGQDLMRIGLVADIPDQPVIGRIEDVVQRHRQLDDAKARAQMSAGDRHRLDGLPTQLVGELPQVRFRQLPQLVRKRHLVQKRFGLAEHDYSSIESRYGPKADMAACLDRSRTVNLLAAGRFRQ